MTSFIVDAGGGIDMRMNINIVEDEVTVPDYAIINEDKICGFFGEHRFLSNFYPCKVGVYWLGTLFPSTEHAYQAAKFPKKYHKEFVDVTAAKSKKLAREIAKADPTLYNDEMWCMVKDTVMSQLVFQKFTNNIDLKNMLLSTGQKHLEETNSWGDVYWGTCNGKGMNKLGKILMATRGYIKTTEL